jgi:hypothetical protein
MNNQTGVERETETEREKEKESREKKGEEKIKR